MPKVDKRYKIYGVENAIVCISMFDSMWNRIRTNVVDKYGPPVWVFHALSTSFGDKVGSYYYESDDEVTTLYFPTQADIDYVDQLLTVERLKL